MMFWLIPICFVKISVQLQVLMMQNICFEHFPIIGDVLKYDKDPTNSGKEPSGLRS